MFKMSKNKESQRLKDKLYLIVFPIIFSILVLLGSVLAAYPYINEFVEMSTPYFQDNDVEIPADCYDIFVPEEDSKMEEISKPEEEKILKDTRPIEQKMIPLSSVTYPYFGQRMGEVIIEDCGIYTTLYFGDGNYELNNGVGMYTGGFIPGYGRTVMIAGHNNMAFNGFKYAQKGQKVTIRTYYGTYTYEITDIQVKLSTDSSAYDFGLNYENLIMYTCYPFDELNLTPYRCFVYAKLISGPVIDKNN